MYTDKMGVRLEKAMIRIMIILFIISSTAYSQKFTQIEIPLSNSRGVPFTYSKEYEDYFIEGFDVDTIGSLYFLGGKPTTLVKFTPNKKILFRRMYYEFIPNQINVQDKKIFIFDNKYEKNTLTILDSDNGRVQKQYPSLLTNIVNNNFWYTDAAIIILVFNYQKEINLHTKTGYLMYGKDGKFIRQEDNFYGLKKSILENISNQTQAEGIKFHNICFLGKLGDTLVFQNNELVNLKGKKPGLKYRFVLANNDGNKIAETYIDSKTLGESFAENPQEHRKLRNKSIYFLTRKGKNAVITQMPIEQLFGLSTNKNK